MYWSAAQQLAHHAAGGCAMCVGDLLGSGTISGPTRDSCGSLLEITWNGRDPVAVDGGERRFVEDGDTVTLSGWCEAPGRRIGFGRCETQVLPCAQLPQA
jgi:fumarylacetoacetase